MSKGNVFSALTNGATSVVHSGVQVVDEAIAGATRMVKKSRNTAGITGSELANISNKVANSTQMTIEETKQILGRENIERLQQLNRSYGNYVKYAGAAGVGIAGANFAFSEE